MIWMSPVVPFEGGEVDKAFGIISSIIERHNFEPARTFQRSFGAGYQCDHF
jgi:hypothetical protein